VRAPNSVLALFIASTALSVGLAVLPGCSAGRASVALVQADRAISNARARGADEQAAYELAMAEAYLIKAREEAHFSSYRDSVELSRGAADWADRAIITMESEGTAGAASAPDAPGGVQGSDPAASQEPDAQPAAPQAPQDPAEPASGQGDAWTQPGLDEDSSEDEAADEQTDAAESTDDEEPSKVIVVPVDPPAQDDTDAPPKLIVVPRTPSSDDAPEQTP